jgi:hypothetical protein
MTPNLIYMVNLMVAFGEYKGGDMRVLIQIAAQQPCMPPHMML